MRKNQKLLTASIIGIVLLVVVDQLIKWWAVTVLKPVGTMPFLKIGGKRILDLTFLENNGAIFSSFSGMRWLLVGVTAVMIVFCIYWLFRNPKQSAFLDSCLTLVIAGGIGNLIDRLFRGGLVVDYLEVKLFRFAVFNFADCCVTVGVVLFAFYLFFWEPRQNRLASADEVEATDLQENSDNV